MRFSEKRSVFRAFESSILGRNWLPIAEQFVPFAHDEMLEKSDAAGNICASVLGTGPIEPDTIETKQIRPELSMSEN